MPSKHGAKKLPRFSSRLLVFHNYLNSDGRSASYRRLALTLIRLWPPETVSQRRAFAWAFAHVRAFDQRNSALTRLACRQPVISIGNKDMRPTDKPQKSSRHARALSSEWIGAKREGCLALLKRRHVLAGYHFVSGGVCRTCGATREQAVHGPNDVRADQPRSTAVMAARIQPSACAMLACHGAAHSRSGVWSGMTTPPKPFRWRTWSTRSMSVSPSSMNASW